MVGYFVLFGICYLTFFVLFWCMQTDTLQYSGVYAALGVDNSVRLDNFCNNFKVEVKRFTDDDIEFDMIGIDPAIANAFRRILIAEVIYFSFPHYLQ